MMTSSNGNIFRVTGPLCGEFTGHRWIPLTKASDVELWCFLWSGPWINGWVNNPEAGDLRRHRAHYDVIVMIHQWPGLIDRCPVAILCTNFKMADIFVIKYAFQIWVNIQRTFCWHDLTFIPTWISNYIHQTMWDEIIYRFPNFNGVIIEVVGMDTSFHPELYWTCDYLPMLWFKLIVLSKRGT